MGITIHYTFLPADLDPTAKPMAAHRLMAQAADIVAPTLRQAGIPCQLPPPVINETEYYQAVIAEGPGDGSEWLLLGWRRLYASEPWSGDQFVKTQYARDFGLTHVAFCESLLRLTAAGLVDPDIFDEGNYLPDRNPEALGHSHQDMAATLGAVGDLLQALKLGRVVK